LDQFLGRLGLARHQVGQASQARRLGPEDRFERRSPGSLLGRCHHAVNDSRSARNVPAETHGGQVIA
jgi:hypothetical protein